MPRRAPWLLFFLSLFLPPCADAQTDVQQGFEKSMLGTEVLPKGFPGETKVQYRWQQNGLILRSQRYSTLGVLAIESVKFQSSKGVITGLTIRGARRTLAPDKGGSLQPSGAPTRVTLNADVGGATADALSHLKDLLFYPDQAAMLADLSPTYPGPPALRPHDSRHPPQTDANAAALPINLVDMDSNHRTPPRALRFPDPEYSNEARRAQINGVVTVGLTVDAQGKPADLWLLSSLGFGLDEKAIEAVAKSRFLPAEQDGKPVSCFITVDINFQDL